MIVRLLGVLVLLATTGVSRAETPEEELERKLKISNAELNDNLLTRFIDIGTRAGFEIGNGRKLIKNLPGQYLLKIYDKWEVGQVDAFTEIISPLTEGVPRARVTINVVEDTEIQTLHDLVKSRESGTWFPVVIGKISGIQQDTVLSSGLHEMEARLFRNPGEVVVLRMDGKPGDQDLTAFDKAQNALTTFQTNLGN